MSYQLILHSVEKVKNELNLLTSGKLSTVYIDTNDPKRLSYLIMQGMAAAQELNLPIICELKNEWKVCIEKSRVRCERTTPIISAPYLEFSDVKDLLDLLDSWMKHKDLGIELRYPSVTKSPEIEEWLSNKTDQHEWNANGILTMQIKVK